MHWLSIHFPLLPLEVFAQTLDDAPVALSEFRQGVQRIRLCNARALAGGVAPGISASAARALLPELRVLRRRASLERAALQGLAGWALQFTAQVTPMPPRSLLLEVQGSRRLFGGQGALIKEIQGQLEATGYHRTLVLAPTPKGAGLLAREGREMQLEGLDDLRRALHPLPLSRIPLPRDRRRVLEGMGLRTLGELLRLPRAGLRQRLGSDVLLWLDRLLGRAPDPQPSFQPPPQFQRRLDLMSETTRTDALLFAAKRLLLELDGFLQARQLGTQTLDWRLGHGGGEATELRLGLLRPERRSEHFLGLLRERLERLNLKAPVRDLELRVESPSELPGGSRDLFEGPDAQPPDRLLERLRTRLGEHAVSGLDLRPDHRPERALALISPRDPRRPAESAPFPGAERPLWLLPRPRPLETIRGLPSHHGPLQLSPERERIEAGWWDGEEVRRDYFIAQSPRGERLWIYRQTDPPRGWFLHGFFG